MVDAGFRGVSARCDTRGIDAPASLIKMLIDEGDILKIDTRSGEYIERVKS
jgi:hypothetical protein